MNLNDLMNLTGCDSKDDQQKKLILSALNDMQASDVIRVALDAKDPLVARIADIWLTRKGDRLFS